MIAPEDERGIQTLCRQLRAAIYTTIITRSCLFLALRSLSLIRFGLLFSISET